MTKNATPKIEAKAEKGSKIPSIYHPSAASGRDGTKIGQERARRYYPDIVDLIASIALSPDSEASIHTRFLAANAVLTVGGAIPQAMPPLLQSRDSTETGTETNGPAPPAQD